MAAAARSKERNVSHEADGDIRVVIADDHRSFGEALQIALDNEDDLTVIEVVTSGESAIESAQAQHPDVLLMDVQMPGVDGLEATRRIRRESSGTKVILLSGYDDDVVLARAVEAGARGFLRKTQAVSDLADAIRRAFRGNRCMRSARSSCRSLASACSVGATASSRIAWSASRRESWRSSSASRPARRPSTSRTSSG